MRYTIICEILILMLKYNHISKGGASLWQKLHLLPIRFSSVRLADGAARWALVGPMGPGGPMRGGFGPMRGGFFGPMRGGFFFSPHPRGGAGGNQEDPDDKKGFLDRLGEILYELFG